MINQLKANATDQYWEALKEVMDPEFPISVVDMGLIYEIEKEGSTVHVKMTYTSTGCACMQWIESDIRNRLLDEADVDAVEINVVWDPAWTVDNMTEEGKLKLKRWGVRA
jgi:metal-sulfur cluster biosynthetic enzyme